MDRVREARRDDAPALANLLDQLGYPADEALIQRRLAGQLDHGDAGLLVAEGDDGQVLGFISLHVIPQLALEGDFCRISYLCVDVSARGRGLGERLVQAAEAYARARGCDRMELHCDWRREAAQRFYARLGYLEAPRYWRHSLK